MVVITGEKLVNLFLEGSLSLRDLVEIEENQRAIEYQGEIIPVKREEIEYLRKKYKNDVPYKRIEII